MNIIAFWAGASSLIAQTPPIIVEPTQTPEEVSLLFSGPQFFIALLSGIVLAFGFQMLLTNLSVAAGASYLVHGSSGSSNSDSSSGMSPKTITLGFGLWTLITVSLALFGACLLAIKLSLLANPLLGAIVGLVIWGTYFSLLVWMSSTTVGSLVGSVVKSATSGFQSIVGTATAALGAKSVSNQVVATAEATAAAVRRELTSGLDREDIKESLRDYIAALRSPELDTQSLQSEIERIIRDSDLVTTADRDSLRQIVTRDAFVELVQSRTDLSPREAQRTADKLYGTWERSISSLDNSSPMQDLVNYLKSAKPDQILSEGIGSRLDKLIEELRHNRNAVESTSEEQPPGDSSAGNKVLASQAFNTLMSLALGRTDLPDFDVDKIVNQIKSAQSKVTGEVESLTESEGQSRIKADVESYLLNAYPWRLKQGDRLNHDFRNVLYDLSADPAQLRRELTALDRSFFADILKSRGLFTQTEIRDISLHLEVIRQTVFKDIQAAEMVQTQKTLYRRLETFLRTTPKDELTSELGERAFEAIIEDDEATAEQLKERYSPLNSAWFHQFLEQRNDLIQEEIESTVNRYQAILLRKHADAEGLQSAAQVRVENQWQKVQDHLRRTERTELNPDGIKRDFELLLEEPDLALRRLRHRVSQFDRNTLVALLAQRQDLSKAEIESVIDSVESSWNRAMRAPKQKSQQLTGQARQQYDQATSTIENYLRNTGKPELNPDDIKRDIRLLVEDPKSGTRALRDRLSSMDRDTLVKLLSQRRDLSEAEIDRTIDSCRLSIVRSIATLARPRLIARLTACRSRFSRC